MQSQSALISSNLSSLFPEILLNSNYKDILSFCQTNKEYRNICNSERFWRAKVNHDFGNLNENEEEEVNSYFDSLPPKNAYLKILESQYRNDLASPNKHTIYFLDLFPVIDNDLFVDESNLDFEVIDYVIKSEKATDQVLDDIYFILGKNRSNISEYSQYSTFKPLAYIEGLAYGQHIENMKAFPNINQYMRTLVYDSITSEDFNVSEIVSYVLVDPSILAYIYKLMLNNPIEYGDIIDEIQDEIPDEEATKIFETTADKILTDDNLTTKDKWRFIKIIDRYVDIRDYILDLLFDYNEDLLLKYLNYIVASSSLSLATPTINNYYAKSLRYNKDELAEKIRDMF